MGWVNPDVERVFLLADGIFLQHAGAAGAVTEAEDGAADVEVDVVGVFHEVAVVGGLVDVLGGVGEDGEGETWRRAIDH